MKPTSRDELFARARRLVPLIESRVLAAEEERTLTSDVVEAFRTSELFWMLVPRELGGLDVDLATYMDVIEEVACADGSAGWTLMANNVAIAIASAFLDDSAVERMFAAEKRPNAVLVGQLTGTARVREGGFSASGRWKFGSGCAHSEWFGGAFKLLEGDGPKLGADGKPQVRIFWFPRERVEIIRQWNTVGLVGTGSFEYVVPEQQVGAEFSFDLINGKPKRGRHFQNLGSLGVAFASHTAVALGMARRALQEVAIVSANRRRAGPGVPPYLLAENPLFRASFAESDAAYRAARAFLRATYREAEAAVRSRGRLTEAEEARLRQAMVSVHVVASDVVRTCWQWSGSDGLFRPGALERVFRDMHAAGAHLLADGTAMVNTAIPLVAAHRDERERTSRGEIDRDRRSSE